MESKKSSFQPPGGKFQKQPSSNANSFLVFLLYSPTIMQIP